MTDLIRRELELPQDVQDVWRALTQPEWLQEWLADEVELDLWPGGDATFVIDGVPHSGWVEEVSPPARGGAGRLAFWWQPASGSATRVCVEAETTPDGTRVRVSEARPLEVIDLVGIPMGGPGGSTYGPALVAA